MATAETETLPPWKLDECAADLNLDDARILVRAIKAGKLVAMVVSGAGEGKAPRTKYYRIARDEWIRYKESIRTKGIPDAITSDDDAPKAGRPRKGSTKGAPLKARRWN
jgi:hypothetical protein